MENAPWPYPDIPPQRYGSNHARYLSRGGIVKINDLAARYTNLQTLPDPNRFFFLCHVFDQIEKEGLQGDVVEIGVYQGDTAVLIAEIARTLGKTAYLLDTFEGFDEQDFQGLDDGRGAAFRDTSLAAVRARIGDPNTVFIKGYFPETATRLPESARYCLVHIDCDLYQPIMSSLEYFYPRMVPGGFIIIHDYNSLGWDGAEKAVDDFFMDRPESVVPVPDSSGSVVARKARAGDGSDNWRLRKKLLRPGDWREASHAALSDMLDHGWSVPEDWGIWGVGTLHTLSFTVAGSFKDAGEADPAGYDLDVDLHASLLGARTTQSADVFVNDYWNSTMTFTLAENRRVWTLHLPAGVAAGELTRIEFRPLFADSPNELDETISDTRRLGLALHRIRLRPGRSAER